MSWLKKEYEHPVRRTNRPKNTILVNDDNHSRREIVNNFNKDIRWILKRFYVITGKSLRVESIMNLLYNAIHEDIEFVIQNVGPELQKYTSLIRGGDVDYFSEHIDINDDEYNNVEGYDNNNLMTLIKEEIPKLKMEEKEEIFRHINTLLDSYMEYVILEMIDPILMWKVTEDMSRPKEPEDYGCRFMPIREYKADYKARHSNKKKNKSE